MSDEKFIIQGLNGAKTLSGSVRIGGAKNAVLKALAATVLFKGSITLNNIPGIEDVRRIQELLVDLGASISGEKNIVVDPTHIHSSVLTPKISRCVRASIVLTGPLLGRLGEVAFPHPGGCVIGGRPIDLFLDGFARMGASVSMKEEMYHVRARDGLVGAELFFKNQSVTGTETFMMAGVLARGITVLKNAALEPEITHLAKFLNTCGARISGAGTPTIHIEGTGLLQSHGEPYETITDRIEAGSFLILGALAARDITLTHCNPDHLEALIYALRTAGVPIETGVDTISIKDNTNRNDTFTAVDIKTHEYPGFPTDLQAPMTVFLTQASGDSRVFETIFERRLHYTEDISRMGANITMMDPHRILIQGPKGLRGQELESPDLRAGLAFVIAAIIARGESVIHNVYNIDRGYERLEKRLTDIGVSIRRA